MTESPRTPDARKRQQNRLQNRAELTARIKDVAREHLATDGPAGLSLRAVAREVGLVSSAVYRYFPSRDDLLTALIVDAYTDVAQAAEEAESLVRRTDLAGRFLALCRGFRGWAVAHPQEYALIFGSPVPGYRAPQDTIDPAVRIPVLLLAILIDAVDDDRTLAPGPVPMPRAVHSDLALMRGLVPPRVGDQWLARGILAWSGLVGITSFELFGHLQNTVTDHPAHFEMQMGVVAEGLGLR